MARGTLNLMAGPQLIARNVLPAIAAREFYVCHNLTSQTALEREFRPD
jgi:hypothetical protein